jgi:hypothetical protein
MTEAPTLLSPRVKYGISPGNPGLNIKTFMG